MMASSHMILGGACWMATCRALEIPPGFEVGAAVAGSLLPDIDHPSSKLGRAVPFLSYPLAALFGHRGITHSLLAISALVGVLIWLGATHLWAAALIVGYLSHLVGDFFTPSGVPLLWPMKARFRAPLTFKTNSFLEPVTVVAVMAAIQHGY